MKEERQDIKISHNITRLMMRQVISIPKLVWILTSKSEMEIFPEEVNYSTVFVKTNFLPKPENNSKRFPKVYFELKAHFSDKQQQKIPLCQRNTLDLQH